MSEQGGAGWRPDPSGKYELRWFDGSAWTDRVSQGGAQAVDPFFAPEAFTPAALAAAAPPPRPSSRRGLVVGAVLAAIVLVALAVVLLSAGGDDGELATDVTEASLEETTTTTEQETTTTTERETTTTTEPALEDPQDVVGSSVAVALADLRAAGFQATEQEVIDESVPDGQVLAAEEQPDGTVVLTVARPPVTRFLEEITPVQREGIAVGGPTFDISGVIYSHGVQMAYCHGESVEYDLGRDFRRFQAVAGQLSTDESDARVRLEIALDGQIVQTNDLSFGEAIPLDLDVTGRQRLRITLTQLTEDDCSDFQFGFGDGRLLGVPSEVPALPEG